MIQITDLKTEEKTPALWRLAFRPFFLAGSIFSFISLFIWQLILSNKLQVTPYGGGYWWHIHEMVFGFVLTIVVGFLLTAVQTWSGLRAINNKPLIALFSVWLCGRIGLLLPTVIPQSFIALIDISFLPLAAFFLAKPIVKRKMYRNLFFVPLLLMFALLNGLMHAYILFAVPLNISNLSYTTLLLISFIISVMIGRVLPMFTANGTGSTRVNNLRYIEWLSNGSLLLLTAISTVNIFFSVNNLLFTILFMIAATSQTYRWLRWRPWITMNAPLLWSLHISVCFLCIALLLLGISYSVTSIPKQHIWHLLTIGCVANIILSMMSRVSLGHTGRVLQTSPIMSIAFVCLPLAAIIRSLGAWLLPQFYLVVITLSTILWLLSFLIFIIHYTPILFKPRIDGRPG